MSRSLRHDVAEQLKVHPSNKRNFHVAHTSSYTLRVQESGSTHTNLGATGAITLTLPQASANKGVHYTFVVQEAQTLTISPGALGAIYIGGSKQDDNEPISSNTPGSSITLECDGNHDWVVTSIYGIWHEDDEPAE